MTTLSPVSTSSWSSCFSGLCADLKANLPCTESKDAAFARVIISNPHKNGQVKVYDSVDPDTGKKTQSTTRSSIVDRTTGDLYLDEKAYVVWVKCIAIMLGMPLYTLATIGWHLTKIPVVITVIAFDILKTVPSYCLENKMDKAWAHFKERVWEIATLSAKEIFEVVKAPFYMIAAESGALVGVFNPYLGRKWVGKIEYSWQNQRSYKEDFRVIPERPGESFWEAFVKDVIHSRAFYLAYCFQVRGNLSNKNIRLVRHHL